MSVEHIIINFLGTVFEIIILNLLFSIIAKRVIKKKYIIIGSVMYVLVGAVFGYFSTIFWVNMMDNIIFEFVFSFLYSMKLYKRIIGSIGISAAFISCEMIMGQLVSIVLGITVEVARDNIFIMIFGLLGSKLLVFFIVLIIRKFISKETTKLSKGLYSTVILFPLSTLVIILAVGQLTIEVDNRPFTVMMMCGVIAIIFSNIILMYVIEKHKEEAVKMVKKDFVNIQLENEIEQYCELVEKYKFNNKKMHDIDNQLIALKGMGCGEAHNIALREVELVVSSARSVVYTGNNSLDALLNNKIDKMKNEGIELSCKVFLSDEKINNAMDICVLLGNILDNAIEECQRIDNNEKQIMIDIHDINNLHQIIVKNSKSATSNTSGTSKNNKQKHGYGTAIIDEIVKKYNGSINREICDENYQISILLGK